jgi:hypothetical protein
VGTVDPRAVVGRVWVQLSSLMQDSGCNAISAENEAYSEHPQKCFIQCGTSTVETEEDLCYQET